MNKRKAFTLIELLAVVVILGLLVAVAYPAVNKYINDTKDTTYTLHEADMKTAASNMMSECIQNDTEDCVPQPGESKTIYLTELVDTKYSNQIKDPDKKDGYCSNTDSYVIVTNTGSGVTNLEYDVCLTCDKYASGKCSELKPGGTCNSSSDTTKPVCGDIVGGSTLWTNKDRVISVKCSDTGCGCTKETFYKTFTETGKTGTITITDKSGKSEECEVNVYVDKDLPTCTLEVTGTMSENNWYGGAAPVVKFSSKNDATSGIATYGFGLSKKSPEFNKLDSYTVKEGISTIFGYVKDNAGNVGICSVEVQYDPVPSSVTSVDYGNIVYPKEDIAGIDGNKRVVTLDKTILDEYGDIYGLYFYQTSSSTGMNVTIKNGSTSLKTVTLSSGVTTPIRVLFDTPIKVSSNNITIDLGANNNINKISRIEIITRNDTVGYYTNQNVTLYINSNDSLSGKAYYTFDGTNYTDKNYYTYTKNTNSVTIGIEDHAGNRNDLETIKITNIDKLKPSCSLKKSRAQDGNGVDWFNKNVDVLFATTNDATATSSYTMSGVRDWSLNNPTGRGTPKTRTQTSATASTTDTGYVIDNAGNIETCQTTVKLDLTDPVAGTVTMSAGGSSISSGAEVNKDVTVTLANGSDTGSVQSGHYTTKFTVVRDGTTVSNNITGSQTYSAEGNYTVTVTTYDQSGRYSTRSYSFMIDKTAPVCGTITGGSTTWINTTRNISVACSDPNGVAKSECTASSFSGSWSTSTKTSTITIKDQAGNTKACSVNVYVDVDKPTCGTNDGTTAWTISNRKVTVNCNDTGGSNCSASSFNNTWSTTTKTSSITISDVAGNTTSCSVNVYVDKTAPSCGTVTNASAWVNTDRTIDQNCTDDHSGCAKTTYSKTYTSNTDTDTITIKDKVGNTNTCTYNVHVDKTKPTCSLKVETTGVSFASKGDTGGSGVANFGLSNQSNSYNGATSVGLAAQSYYGTVRDNAGNVGACSVTLTNATPHYKKTVKKCTEYVSSYTCRYLADFTYNKTIKTCSRSGYCADGFTMYGGTCYKNYNGAGDYCSKQCSIDKGLGPMEAICAHNADNLAFCIDYPGITKYSYSFSTKTTQGGSCTKGTSFTCSASTYGSSYVSNCVLASADCLSGSNYVQDGEYCYKWQSSSSCDSFASLYSTNYGYEFRDTVNNDTTSCSPSNSFTCNSGNKNSSYTVCDFTKYTCSSGTLVSSYCYS